MHRLWNNTLLQLSPKVDSVQIVSRAKIYLPSELSLQQNRSDDKIEVSFWFIVMFCLAIRLTVCSEIRRI